MESQPSVSTVLNCPSDTPSLHDDASPSMPTINMKNAPEKDNLLGGLGFLLKQLAITLEPSQKHKLRVSKSPTPQNPTHISTTDFVIDCKSWIISTRDS